MTLFWVSRRRGRRAGGGISPGLQFGPRPSRRSRGEGVAPTPGRLPASWGLHTAGPIWSPDEDRSAVLRSCYTESLRVADGLGARSVAFPAISAGVYGWPLEDAAVQAVAGVRAAAVEHVQEVRFVLFDDRALAAF